MLNCARRRTGARRLRAGAVLVVAALLLFTPSLGRGVHARSPPRLMPTVAGGPALPIGGGGSLPRPSPPPLQPANGTSYDEQLGITFAQSFTSILYNVTFVEQADNVSGSGPAYLLNGLSDAGYWYQVGVSWNWVPGQGVGFSYEVFGANGTSVYPSGGGAGLGIFSGPVASGDRVALNLYFSGKNVEMVAEDLNTSASASTSYSSEGGSSFVGLTGPGNQNGFFTGLMTEWYHPQPYYGDEQGVTYVTSSPLTSAWMWIDEVGCPDFQCSSPSLLFSAHKGPILYSNPTEFVKLTSNGATEKSNAYSFVTGSLAPGPTQVSMTFSYSVVGPSNASPPVLTYYQGGVLKSAFLSGGQSAYLMDAGSFWNVSPSLDGSGAAERWEAAQATAGVAGAPAGISLTYYCQYFVVFAAQVSGGGTGYSQPLVSFVEFGTANQTTAGTGAWVDAGTHASFPSLLQGSTASERWAANSTSVLVGGYGTMAAAYLHQFLVGVSASPPGGGVVSAESGWFDAGSNVTLRAVPSSGWAFAGWSGTVAGAPSGNVTSIESLSGPANESALFYPGLSITVSGGGSVSYSLAGGGGTVASGSKTLYEPAGSAITLTANPSSPLYAFAGWGGSASGSGTAQVLLSAPKTATAKFGYNYALLGALALVGAAALGSIAFLAVRAERRRRPGHQGPGSEAAPWARDAGPASSRRTEVSGSKDGPARSWTGDSGAGSSPRFAV